MRSCVLFQNLKRWDGLNNLYSNFCTSTAESSEFHWKNFGYGDISDKQNEWILEKKEVDQDPIWKDLTKVEVDIGIDVLSKLVTENRLKKFQEVLKSRSKGIRFVFENPANVNNVWASLRTFDSLGIQYCDLILDPSRYINPKKRSSMVSALGAQKWLSIKQFENSTTCLKELKAKGYKIAVTDISPESVPLSEVDFKSQKTAIILGNEVSGSSEEVKNGADIRFHLPMKGFSESLNISAFCALLAGKLNADGALSMPYGRLDNDEEKRILLSWLAKTVPKASTVMRHAGIDKKDNKVWPNVAGFSTKP